MLDLKIVEEILKPYLEQNNLKFYDCVLEKEDGNLFLRVFLDNDGGISIDELSNANDFLSSKIDQYDKDLPNYYLEVSSPGAEKVLKTKDDIVESIGKYIHVEIENMIYEGTLESFDDDKLVMRINAKGRFKNVSIDYSSIKLVRLAIKF